MSIPINHAIHLPMVKGNAVLRWDYDDAHDEDKAVGGVLAPSILPTVSRNSGDGISAIAVVAATTTTMLEEHSSSEDGYSVSRSHDDDSCEEEYVWMDTHFHSYHKQGMIQADFDRDLSSYHHTGEVAWDWTYETLICLAVTATLVSWMMFALSNDIFEWQDWSICLISFTLMELLIILCGSMGCFEEHLHPGLFLTQHWLALVFVMSWYRTHEQSKSGKDVLFRDSKYSLHHHHFGRERP